MIVPEITFPATEAKNRFGELLEVAHREPVGISKQGRPFAVILSIEEYTSIREKLGELNKPLDLSWLEDWRISMAKKGGSSASDEADYYQHLDDKYGG